MSRTVSARVSLRRLRSVARLGFGLLALSAALLAPFVSSAQGPTSSPIDLDLYDRLLAAHTVETTDVVGTRVDYAALKRSAEWKSLVRQVESARPSGLARNERLAFWINAYNILTIDLINQNYPVDSIKDIGSLLFPVWNRTVATIEGEAQSLGGIEHEILRKMDEPRIHAAIVCASTSCPPLARTAFRAERLDADLDAAMTRWLADDRKGVAIDRKRGSVRVSKIFDWFEEDFEAGGGVLATIARHVPEADATWLRGAGRNARLAYFDYDWSLNAER